VLDSCPFARLPGSPLKGHKGIGKNSASTLEQRPAWRRAVAGRGGADSPQAPARGEARGRRLVRGLGARLRHRQTDTARCAERCQPPLQASAQARRAARNSLARPQALVLHSASQQGRASQVRSALGGARQHTAHSRPLLALDADHGQAHRKRHGRGARRRRPRRCAEQRDRRPLRETEQELHQPHRAV
jgi:hypothetical protein